MSNTAQYLPGQIIWRDLTVPDAEGIRDFYSQVVGWQWANHDMGEYNDYDIKIAATDEVIMGICHARDTNANLPPVWLMYIYVADIAASAQKCLALGGKILDGPRAMGAQQFCVIQDPVGAILALMGDK